MKKTASWVRKKPLISRFWDARSHMYNTGRIASQIVTRAFVVLRPRRIDADDVFEWLTKFEEEKKSGKRKTTTPRTCNNKKKPRPVEPVPEEPFDPMTEFSEKNEKKTLKTDFEKYRHMYPFGPTSVYHILVEKIREALPIIVYRSINFQYQFKSIVCQTMGRRSYREVIPLVCYSDETYAAFEKFVKRWKDGKIPDVHGTIGPSKDPRTGLVCDRDVSQLSVNRFMPINGLSDEDLKLAWIALEEGKVWVTKPASYKEQHGSWGHLARAYSISEQWLEMMLKFIHEKGDEAVLEKASSSEEESNKNKKNAKKKTVEVLPSQITTAIHRLYTAKHGIAAPSRQEPLHILHLPSICQYKLTLDEQLDCKLVFLDVTHPNLVLWGKPEFCSFMGIVRDLTVSKEFTIVSVMDYGQQLVDFTSAIKEMKDAKVIFEVGCYENEMLVRKTNLAKPTWQLVYAFVSLGPEEYKPKLVENFDYRHLQYQQHQHH
ncbi:hypothetical protein R1sor_004894 [Riccia sorocarpa]|uniref:Uncharacterized protein n=1 Tax=Riccia sorocarpa TaxID=122646 RepID=A0ABD3HIK4_9MARC